MMKIIALVLCIIGIQGQSFSRDSYSDYVHSIETGEISIDGNNDAGYQFFEHDKLIGDYKDIFNVNEWNIKIPFINNFNQDSLKGSSQGEDFMHLRMKKINHDIHGTFRLNVQLKNGETLETIKTLEDGCWFIGESLIHEPGSSTAVMNVCKGLDGHISIGNDYYELISSVVDGMHKLYKRKDDDEEKTCVTVDDEGNSQEEHIINNPHDKHNHHNLHKKISMFETEQYTGDKNDHIIELWIGVDKAHYDSVYPSFNDKELTLRYIINGVINIILMVDSDYQSTGIGLRVSIQTLEIWSEQNALQESVEAGTYLNNVRTYKSTNFPEADTAAMLTGINIQYDGSSGVAGLAGVNTVCNRNSGSINEYGRGSSRGILSHEVGHNVGSAHDTDLGCPNGFIMYPSVNGAREFSTCSIQAFQNRIDRTSCMTNITTDNFLSLVSECSEGCNKCFTSPTDCQECEENLYKTLDGHCVMNCEFGQYADDDGTCQSCSSTCRSCSGDANTCTSCNDDRIFNNYQCTTGCPGGYFKHEGNLGAECRKCNGQCGACTSIDVCTSCITGLYLEEGICKSQCSAGYRANDANSRCERCNDYDCIECLDARNQCTKCKSKFLDGTNCRTFQQCTGPNKAAVCNAEGNTCIDNSTVAVATPAQCPGECSTCCDNGKCSSCIEGYVLQDFACVQRCKEGYYFDGNDNCLACTGNCKTCAANNLCLSCDEGRHLDIFTCRTSCPTGSYSRDGICTSCADNCETCTEGSTQCSSCKVDYFLDESTNRCVKECPKGTYKGSTTCVECDPGCLNCTATTCTECGDDWFLDPLDEVCVSFDRCPFFHYPSCDSGRMCTSGEQPDRKCHSSCKTCCSAAKDGCTSCPEGKFLQDGICLDSCESNTQTQVGVGTRCLKQQDGELITSSKKKSGAISSTIGFITIITMIVMQYFN